MLRDLLMAEVTWKPFAAAFELQRHDIGWAVIMLTARFRIDIDAADFDTVNCSRHTDMRSRGQTRTNTEPTIQHAIITTKPVLNEPVR